MHAYGKTQYIPLALAKIKVFDVSLRNKQGTNYRMSKHAHFK